jgi:hypothetical protein
LGGTSGKIAHFIVDCLPRIMWEFEYGAVAFFDLQNGVKLALWPRKSIAYDSTIPLQPPSSTELTIGHNVNSKKEVDAVMKQAKEAGAKIVKSAGDTFWGGYAGYFRIPMVIVGVVWNQQMKIED